MPAPIAFEQDPNSEPGAGNFAFDDGSSLFAYEPELAARLGAQIAALPDQRVAGQGASGDFGPIEAGPPAPPPGPAPAGPPLPPGMVLPPGMPPPKPRPPGPPAVTGEVLDARDQQSAQQRQFMNTPQAIGKSQTVTEEGQGAPYDPRAAQGRLELAGAVGQAQIAQLEAERDKKVAEGLAAQAEIPRLAAGAAQAAAELDAQKKQVANDKAAIYRRIQANDASAKVDPDRYMHSRGTMAEIGMVLGQAMGAFGASITGGENWAYKLVQGAIDRDIAAQESDIKARRVGDNNELARLADELGDLDQAKDALKMIQLDKAAKTVAIIAGDNAVGDTARARDLLTAQLAQDFATKEQAIADKSIGKRTVTTQSTLKTPAQMQAEAQGGDPLKREFEAEKMKRYLRGEADASGNPLKGKSDQAQEGEAVAKRQFNTAMSSYDTVESKVLQLVQANGGQVEKRGGKWVITKAPDVPFDLPGGDTGTTAKYKADLASVGIQYGNALNQGKELNAGLQEKVIPTLGMSTSPNENIAQLQSMLDNVADDKNALGASVNAPIRGERKENYGETKRESRAENTGRVVGRTGKP